MDVTFTVDRTAVSTGRLEDQSGDYQRECAALTAVERLAVIQYLRECYWGDEAVSSRFSRIPEGTERGGR